MKENYIKILKRFGTIYFFTCDPGAFYAAEPIYEDMKAAGKKCIWIFDGWCARNKNAIIESERANDFKRDTLNIDIASSCIIIGGQACSRCNFSMIEHCKKIGLFSIYLFDNWGTYLDNLIDIANNEIHFTDMIFIIDEISKINIINEITPYVKDYSYFENIIIAGHQGIEKAVTLVKNIPDRAISEFRNRFNPHGKRLVLLALEPLEDFGYLQDGNPFRGYNEFTTLRYIFKHLDLSRVKLLIKPHPRHEKGVIEEFISRNVPTGIFDFEIIQDCDLITLIAASDEVLGMTSTVLVIALKCGKQIRSFQIDRNKNGEKALNHYIEPYVILE